MKKKSLCLICAAVLLVVLFLPFRVTRYDDGGSVQITALAYSIVKWNRPELYLNDDGTSRGGRHENTCVYLFPNNLKDLKELWEIRH
jgi:hypothetical protein